MNTKKIPMLVGDFADIQAEDYNALVIPGRRAPEYTRLNKDVLDMARHLAQADKPIAATCHGAQVLAAAGFGIGRFLLFADLGGYGV